MSDDAARRRVVTPSGDVTQRSGQQLRPRGVARMEPSDQRSAPAKTHADMANMGVAHLHLYNQPKTVGEIASPPARAYGAVWYVFHRRV